MKSLSRVQLLATPWIAAYQAPPSMGFSRQEFWSGVPLPSPFLNTIPFQIPTLYNWTWPGETLLYLVQTRPCTVDGKQQNSCSCLIVALHSQLVGSPYLWRVDLLYDLKDIFVFGDFLPHVSSTVTPSPFYSPSEHLQNKGGSQGTGLCVLRGMRDEGE